MSNYNERNPTLSFRVDKKEKNHLDRVAEKKKMNVNELAKDVLSKYLKIKNNFAENFERPMTRRAEIAIKPQIIEQKQVFQNPQSPYDASNLRLQCVDCGSLFCWYNEQEFNSQMAEFQRHLVSKHNRVKTEIERQVLIELKYEGDSR